MMPNVRVAAELITLLYLQIHKKQPTVTSSLTFTSSRGLYGQMNTIQWLTSNLRPPSSSGSIDKVLVERCASAYKGCLLQRNHVVVSLKLQWVSPRGFACRASGDGVNEGSYIWWPNLDMPIEDWVHSYSKSPGLRCHKFPRSLCECHGFTTTSLGLSMGWSFSSYPMPYQRCLRYLPWPLPLSSRPFVAFLPPTGWQMQLAGSGWAWEESVLQAYSRTGQDPDCLPHHQRAPPLGLG